MKIQVDDFHIDISSYNPYGTSNDEIILWHQYGDIKTQLTMTPEQAKAISLILAVDWWAHE